MARKGSTETIREGGAGMKEKRGRWNEKEWTACITSLVAGLKENIN